MATRAAGLWTGVMTPLGDPRIGRTSFLFPEEREWPNEITHAQDPRRAASVGSGLSKRQIATSFGIGPTAAGECLLQARETGISWPLPDDLGDAELERRLYPAPAAVAKDWRSLPDWAVHRELRRKGVTLQLVWEEYRAAHPDGYGRGRATTTRR